MSIVQKVLLWFLGLILLPTLVVGGLLYVSFRGSIVQEAIKHLEYVADIKKQRIEDIVSQNQRSLDSFTNGVLLPATVAKYQKTRSTEDLALLNKTLETSKNASDRYMSLTILNLEGKIIASSDAESIGEDRSGWKYFADATQRNDTYETGLDSRGWLYSILSGPIMYGGHSVAVVIIEVNSTNLQELVKDYAGLGETGETILLGKDKNDGGVYISELRFDKDAAMHRMINMQNADSPAVQALNGVALTRDDVASYRGHPVISISRGIKGSDWGIIIQVDQSEAYKSLSQLVDTLAILMFIILVAGGFTALYAARIITDPFIIISLALKRIRNGDLSARVDLGVSRDRNDEFGTLGRTINSMAKSLQGLDKMKTEFILLTSHQLRTPASAVKGFLSLLMKEDAKSSMSAKQKKLVEGAYRENERQLHLIGQILTISQAESNQAVINKSKFNLTEAAKSAISQSLPIMKSHGQKAVLESPDEPIVINGDKDKITMAIENILTNASKYSPDNTKIEVSVKAKRTMAVVKVRDNGFGIKPEDMDRLFRKFSRLENPNSVESQGSGLGLYLVKMLAELHGGNIEAKSNKSQGTTFILKLPYK